MYTRILHSGTATATKTALCNAALSGYHAWVASHVAIIHSIKL